MLQQRVGVLTLLRSVVELCATDDDGVGRVGQPREAIESDSEVQFSWLPSQVPAEPGQNRAQRLKECLVLFCLFIFFSVSYFAGIPSTMEFSNWKRNEKLIR